MATPASPARKRILAMLEDRYWHQRELVILEAARAVPPGQAWRQAENDRASWRTGQRPRVPKTQEQTIAVGSRAIARRTLNQLIKHGDVETNGALVRLR